VNLSCVDVRVNSHVVSSGFLDFVVDKVEMMVDEASELIVENANCLQAREIKADPRFGIVHRYVTLRCRVTTSGGHQALDMGDLHSSIACM
jgi:hypothetical protein